MVRRITVVALLSLCTACTSDFIATTVAFGDSVTFGWGGERGGWVTYTEEDLGRPIANYGWPGERVVNGRHRFTSATGPLALAPWGYEVTLLHGGNDLVDLFESEACNRECTPDDVSTELDEITGYVEEIMVDGYAQARSFYLGTYWHVREDMCAEGPLVLEPDEVPLANDLIDAYNARIVDLAADYGETVVRLDELGLHEDADWYHDCIHPDAEGYRIIADAWVDALAY